MERQTCSKEYPMPKGDKGRWNHPESNYLGDEYGSLGEGGSYEWYECRICGLRYTGSVFAACVRVTPGAAPSGK